MGNFFSVVCIKAETFSIKQSKTKTPYITHFLAHLPDLPHINPPVESHFSPHQLLPSLLNIIEKYRMIESL